MHLQKLSRVGLHDVLSQTLFFVLLTLQRLNSFIKKEAAVKKVATDMRHSRTSFRNWNLCQSTVDFSFTNWPVVAAQFKIIELLSFDERQNEKKLQKVILSSSDFLVKRLLQTHALILSHDKRLLHYGN